MPNLLLFLTQLQRSRRVNVPRRKLDASLLVTVVFPLCIVVAHMLAMRIFESMGAEDAPWLTATTLTTAGFGDYSPTTTVGRLVSLFVVRWWHLCRRKARRGLLR